MEIDHGTVDKSCKQACLSSSLWHDVIHEKLEIVLCCVGVFLPTVKKLIFNFSIMNLSLLWKLSFSHKVFPDHVFPATFDRTAWHTPLLVINPKLLIVLYLITSSGTVFFPLIHYFDRLANTEKQKKKKMVFSKDYLLHPDKISDCPNIVRFQVHKVLMCRLDFLYLHYGQNK